MKMKDFKEAKHKTIIALDDNINDKDLKSLTTRAKEVPCDKESLRFTNSKELYKIISTLKSVIENNNIASLSAPQIGYDARVFALDFEGEIKTFINPFISDGNGLTLSRETCSSLPGIEFLIPRRKEITIYAQSPTGQIQPYTFRNTAACVVQHCIDHLDGVLLCDIGLELDEDFDKATKEEQDELISWYIGTLELQKEELNTEIENDEVLGGIKKAFDFVEAVANGDIEITTIPEDQKNPDINYD